MREEGLQRNSLVVGTHLMTQLAKLRDKYEIVGDVRGKGLMIGVEMVKDKVRMPGSRAAGRGELWGVVDGSLLPQLTISRSRMDHLQPWRAKPEF